MSRALCQFALDRNADAFEEIRPPSLVTTATLTATGQLPKFADDAYAIERDDLWCIPTAEVPAHLDRAATRSSTRRRCRCGFMAYTPCYRREAGSAGKDTRGLLRSHEFDKVEILAYATPEQAPAMLRRDRDRAEALIAGLGLTYRIIEICTGDLGQSHHRSFDIEVYAPGLRPLARGVLGQLVQRLPGPARQPALPPGRPEGHGDRPHPERLGARRARGSWPRSGRPTASPTDRSRCPRRCGPTSAVTPGSRPADRWALVDQAASTTRPPDSTSATWPTIRSTSGGAGTDQAEEAGVHRAERDDGGDGRRRRAARRPDRARP